MTISINIATYSQRSEPVKVAIESIKKQTVKPDVIRVFYNDYEPESIEGVEQHYSGFDYTDNAKFIWLDEIRATKKHEIYFTCDDDLEYPPDYIERTIEQMKRYPKHLVSYHGRFLRGTNRSYYHGHRQFPCLITQPNDEVIHVPGSGVSAFNTREFLPDIMQYPERKMTDVLLGLEMAKNGIRGICLKHESMWIQHQPINTDNSIYATEHRKGHRQSELANEIYRLLKL